MGRVCDSFNLTESQLQPSEEGISPWGTRFGGLAPIGEALATTGYDLFGGLVP